jgi:hypothetical protein
VSAGPLKSAHAPVRLTFPAYDIGAADILTGIILAGFSCWRAYLYPALQDTRARLARDCEEVTGRTLGELREKLRKRVEVDGPWWQ